MHKLPACNQGNRESKGGLFQMLLFLRTTLGDCLPYYHGTLALALSHSPSPSLSLLSLSITFNPPIWGFFHLNDQLQRCRVKGEAQQSRGGLRRGVNWRADGKVQKELKIGKHTCSVVVCVCVCMCVWVGGWVGCVLVCHIKTQRNPTLPCQLWGRCKVTFYTQVALQKNSCICV